MFVFSIVCIKLIIDGIFYNRFIKMVAEIDPVYNNNTVDEEDDDETI